jgi:DNA-binding transcriptional LysR family regulator
MNLKFLETFVWVARLKSFRLTADKAVHHPGVGVQPHRRARRRAWVKLFLRDSRGVSLTPEG